MKPMKPWGHERKPPHPPGDDVALIAWVALIAACFIWVLS